MDGPKHGAEGHTCPPYVLTDEECAMLPEWERFIEEHGPYDTEDPTFWVPHQTEDRMVAFNRLTSTIDDIITQCKYPESERDRLAETHRRLAARYLQYYDGPIEGPVPLLGVEPAAVRTH